MSGIDDEDLLARLRDLPREIAPSRDLWPAVTSRLDARRAELRRRRARRAWALGGAIAAAAAVVLVFGAFRRARPPHGDAIAHDMRSATPTLVLANATREGAPLLPEEGTYVTAIRELKATVAGREGELPSATAEALQENVRGLDAAIAEARGALATHPGDDALRAQLRDEYQQEIDVLGDVIDLTTRT